MQMNSELPLKVFCSYGLLETAPRSVIDFCFPILNVQMEDTKRNKSLARKSINVINLCHTVFTNLKVETIQLMDKSITKSQEDKYYEW